MAKPTLQEFKKRFEFENACDFDHVSRAFNGSDFYDKQLGVQIVKKGSVDAVAVFCDHRELFNVPFGNDLQYKTAKDAVAQAKRQLFQTQYLDKFYLEGAHR